MTPEEQERLEKGRRIIADLKHCVSNTYDGCAVNQCGCRAIGASILAPADERIGFLEARCDELQRANTRLLTRARTAEAMLAESSASEVKASLGLARKLQGAQARVVELEAYISKLEHANGH